MNLSNYPILKILIPYIFGIIPAYFELFPWISCSFLFFTIIGFALFSAILFYNLNYNKQWIAGCLMQFAFFFSGFLFTQYHFSVNKDIELIDSYRNTFLVVEIIDSPIEKENSIKCTGKVKKALLNNGDNANTVSFLEGEKAILYFRKPLQEKKVTFGNIIVIPNTLNPIAPPRNPHAFDYQNFARKRGIALTGYFFENNFRILGHSRSKPLKQTAHQLQQFFSSLFSQSGLNGDEYSIITAILLGNDDSMDPSLRNSYAQAGVSHILCVSGMHVGIIYMIISFLLSPLDLHKRSRVLKTIILLFAIWFYAHLAGLSPSIQRAAVMFTFTAIGGIIQRSNNIFHSLFASLFFLLMINPILLFEIGFQLSYLAVFGIVIFQKAIKKIWSPKNKILSYFWELATVSISAQLATFPIAIFYFGQFPNYFLLSNLSVILLSFIIIVTGIIVLGVSFSTFLSLWSGKLLTLEIKSMNAIISFIENLPGSVTENISISVIQLLLLYSIIILLFLLLQFHRKKTFWVLFTSTMLFFLIGTYHNITSRFDKSITIYSIAKKSAINFNYHGKSILLTNFVSHKSNRDYNFHIQNHERQQQIKSNLVNISENAFSAKYKFYKNNHFIKFDDCTFYILSENDLLYPMNNKIKIDYLYISQNPKLNPEIIESVFEFSYIIIDESNSHYHSTIWEKYCKKKGIDYWNTRETGGFRIDCYPVNISNYDKFSKKDNFL